MYRNHELANSIMKLLWEVQREFMSGVFSNVEYHDDGEPVMYIRDENGTVLYRIEIIAEDYTEQPET